MCENIICIIVMTLLSLLLIYITCLGHFRVRVICGVFPSRIYIADSLHVSAPAYFGKRGVTGFSWYQSQVHNKMDQVHAYDLRRVIFALQ